MSSVSQLTTLRYHERLLTLLMHLLLWSACSYNLSVARLETLMDLGVLDSIFVAMKAHEYDAGLIEASLW